MGIADIKFLKFCNLVGDKTLKSLEYLGDLMYKVGSWATKHEQEVVLTALTIIAITFSFLNPLWYENQAPNHEGSLIAIIGRLWSYGEILYHDMIDVKGPGVFFINMVGYRLGGYVGIAFIESLLFVLGIIFTDLALRTFKFNPISRYCSIVIVVSLLGLRYYTGNLTENYTISLAMISSYPFALLFTMRRFKWKLSIIPAIAFAYTSFMRVNNGAYFLAWYTMLFLFYAHNGYLKDSFKLASSMILGYLSIGSCFAIYFYLAGGTELLNHAFYYSLLIYFQSGNSVGDTIDFFTGSVGLWRTGLFVVILGYAFLIRFKDSLTLSQTSYKERYWLLLYLCLGVGYTIVSNSFTGHIYNQYDQLFLPYMLIPLAFLMHRYLDVRKDIHYSFLVIMCLLVFLVSEHLIWNWNLEEWDGYTVFKHIGINFVLGIVVSGVLYFIRSKIGSYEHSHPVFFSLIIVLSLLLCCHVLTINNTIGVPTRAEERNIETIKANTDFFDRIWIHGRKAQYYIWTDRLPSSNYLYQQNQHLSYDVQQKVNESLMYVKPKFIILKENSVKNLLATSYERNHLDKYSRSEQAFYKYVFSNYFEVSPGLYVSTTDTSLLNDTIDFLDMWNEAHGEKNRRLSQ